MIMTKIIIVDYSLEIVIVIIYDHHNLHWMMFIHCLKQSDAIFLHENKQAENTLAENLL